jgi:hypothetical protein
MNYNNNTLIERQRIILMIIKNVSHRLLLLLLLLITITITYNNRNYSN